MELKRTRERHSSRLYEPTYLKSLFAAGARATSLGIAVLDSQTRFEAVNDALARETQAPTDYHLGRTSREVTGDFAGQIEPTYESVLRTGKPASILLTGQVRDTPEFGYWLDHCFPIFGRSGRVQQLGLFVVNVTAENTSNEIFDALATDPKMVMAEAAGLLDDFDESIKRYHRYLTLSLNELGCRFTAAAQKTDRFRESVRLLDTEIRNMQELIYGVISQFSIPAC